MKDPLKYSGQPRLKSPSLVVSWSTDAGQLGVKVTDYLNRKLGGESFGEIEPLEFFAFDGVTIEDDLVQFPESRFYVCPDYNLVVLKSTTPSHEWYQFINSILDVAQRFDVKELHAIGGMVSISAHTANRELLSVFNSAELKETLGHYNLTSALDYETPPGQRPTLNSFLLWAAWRRKIPGVSLWVPVPFYLVAVDDPKAQRRVLEFFNQRFNLGIDFGDIDEEVRHQEQAIAEVMGVFPDIEKSVKKLEGGLGLSDEEGKELVREIEKLLREKRGSS